MRILHLSDTHIDAVVGVNAEGVDSRASLRRILSDCRYIEDIDLLVVSGDVADDGSAGAYADAAALIGEFAKERGVPHVYSTGNHDERVAFTKVLGSGHLDAEGRDVGHSIESPEGERAAVSKIRGYRIITLPLRFEA